MSLLTSTTSFIGRIEEVARVVDLLTHHRLVTLTGAGGSGKTRLALAAAETYGRNHQTDVTIVPLAAITTHDRVPSAIAAALGVQESAHGATLDALVTTITDRELLLVLDNVEQVIEAAPALAEILAACPSLRMLVTSRIPLRLSTELLLVVPPLGLPERADRPESALAHDAVQLFMDRARRVRRAFTLTSENVAAVIELCRRLDGLPLAIELAAARVRHLSPASILARMDRQLSLLTGGPRDAPERQQTMEATIAWSYDLLTPAQQRLFTQMAVFPGGWTLDAAEAVTDVDLDALDGLSELADQSLVLVAGDGITRYRMLEPIREFAVEMFRASEQMANVQQRMARFYSRFVEDGEPPTYWSPISDAWLRACEIEHVNLRAALDWHLEHQPVDALHLASSLYWFWRMHGHMTEGRRWLEEALQLNPDPPPMVRAKALASLADLACWQNDLDMADRWYRESLTLYLELGETDGVGRTRYGLGRTAQFSNDLALAQERYEECMAFYDAIGDADGFSTSRFNLAATLTQLGELDRAQQLYEASHTQALQSGDHATIAIGYANLAGLAIHRRDWPGVLRNAGAALRLYDIEADFLHIIECIEYVAVVLAETGQPARAARLWSAADAQRQRVGYTVFADEQAEKTEQLAMIARALDTEAFETALAEGQSMFLRGAITDALAVELTVETLPSSRAATVLSKRELDVLRGLVDAKTNQEIAAELFISPNTVTNHVTNILNKLGLDSRTAAATYAVRHGLA